MKVLLNNQIVDEKDAKISALDRGYLMGDGIFSTLTIQDGKILFFEDHIVRLKDGCKKIKIIFPKIDISKIFELITVNNKRKGKFRLRITISRKGKFSYELKEEEGNIIMFIPDSGIVEKKNIKLTVFPKPVISSIIDIKTISYFERFWIKKFAIDKKFDDCIVLGPNEEILETSFGNIFWVKNNSFYLPSKKLPYLFGITLKNLIKAAKNLNMEIAEGVFTVKDLEGANVFLSSSTLDFVNVSKIDNLKFLRDFKFEDVLRKEFEKMKVFS